ncbi:MAG: hypothetical protein ACXVLO_05595 [Acidimicrobiia bacterium]
MNALRALVVLLGWAVLPGLAAGALATARDEDDDRAFERFVAVALTSAFVSWTTLARTIGSFGWLDETNAWIGTAILGLGSLAVLLGPRRAVVANIVGRRVRTSMAWVGGWLLPSLPIAGWIVADRATFVNSTPWYYTDLVRQTVLAHGTPQWSYEWGQRLRFLDDYPGFSAGAGVVHAVTAEASIAAEHVIPVFVVLALALSVALLVRAVGGSRFGALIGVLVVMTSAVFVTKLLAFRPESSGYPLMLLVPVLVFDWLRRERVSSLVVAALGFATLGQIHGIDLTMAAVLIAAAVLAVAAEHSSVRRSRSLPRAALMLVGALAGAWLVSAGAWGGGLSGITKVGGLPQVRNGVDPTYLFNALVTRMGDLGTPPSPSALAVASLRTGFLGLKPVWSGLAFIAGVIGLVAARRSYGGVRLRGVATFVGSAFVGAIGVGVALSLQWDTYVPRRTGLDRLLRLWPVLLAVVVGCAAGAVVESLRGRRRHVVLGVVVLLAALLVMQASDPLSRIGGQHPPAGQTDALRAFGLPPDAVVLMNAYTESYPVVAAGIHPVLNGRAPYTQRHLLARANVMVAAARRFFSSSPGPLPCRGITHVVAAVDGNWRLATPNVFGTDVAGLVHNPHLRLKAFDQGVMVFRVRPGTPALDRRCVPPSAAR